jgi:hypothetical protein
MGYKTLELSPGTVVQIGEMGFTAVAGEQEFQPFEKVSLIKDGALVGVGQITRYAHSRLSDVTEVNFCVIAIDPDAVAEQVDEDFVGTPEASFC